MGNVCRSSSCSGGAKELNNIARWASEECTPPLAASAKLKLYPLAVAAMSIARLYWESVAATIFEAVRTSWLSFSFTVPVTVAFSPSVVQMLE